MLPAPNPVFDQLFAAGRAEILAGTHQRDEPPVEGGRYPVTVVAFPPPQIRDRLADWSAEAVRRAGEGHFRTGMPESVHFTVRALEHYREEASPDDPIVADWRAAIERTAAATAPIEFWFTGLTLTRTGVLAQLEPVDQTAWTLMDRLRTELGSLAWLEDAWMKRNIWYASLLHFTGDIADAGGLIDWVDAHRWIEPERFRIDSLSLVRFRHHSADGWHVMMPERWLTVPFGPPGRPDDTVGQDVVGQA